MSSKPAHFVREGIDQFLPQGSFKYCRGALLPYTIGRVAVATGKSKDAQLLPGAQILDAIMCYR